MLQNILGALGGAMDGISETILAMSFGFAAFPTALGFLVGAAGMLIFNQIAPISLQAESIVMAGTMGKNRNERLNIVFFGGLVMAALGAFGVLGLITDFVGDAILSAMMAGVGIILTKTAIDLMKENPIVGGASVAVSVLVYLLTYDFIYTLVISAVLASIVHAVVNRKKIKENPTPVDLSIEKFEKLKFNLSPRLIRSILAMCTLQIGGNIAYASITASLANAEANIDAVTIYSGLADSVSSFFGGAPVEAIISGTAAAPNPQLCATIMMLIVAAACIFKLVPILAKYIPSQCISGFLFVLGAFSVFPENASIALSSGDPVIVSVTAMVTATVDPFIGMCSGVLLRAAMAFFG